MTAALMPELQYTTIVFSRVVPENYKRGLNPEQINRNPKLDLTQIKTNFGQEKTDLAQLFL